MGEETAKPSPDASIDSLIDAVTVPPPKPKEKGWEVSMREKMEMSEVMEKCMEVRMLLVCEGDEVLLRIGRYWYSGEVIKVGKLGIVLRNQNHEVAVALGKISVIEVLKRGKYYELYRQIKG